MKITGHHYLNSRTETERIIEGRKVFVTMVTELNACFEPCKAYSAKFNIQESELNKLAYRIFFFGSFSELVTNANNQQLVAYCKAELKKIRKEHRTNSGGMEKFHVEGKIISIHIKYAPFSGHESHLAHYYRHLFTTVKFVVKKEKEGLFSYKVAREYLKILRARMSNDEQILLYHNYISGIGKDWEKADNQFLSKYRMLHNLPIDNIKYVESPRNHFKTVIDQISKLKEPDPMFEWGDIN